MSDAKAMARVLFVCDGLRIASMSLFALSADLFVAVTAFCATSVLLNTARPIYTAWLNQQLESGSSATVLSMSGQLDALGQIVGGPAVGALALQSLRDALVVTAITLVPALPLYVRATRRMAVNSIESAR
jgi:MFS transporter, DHA3 family, tetracycline resistance protein